MDPVRVAKGNRQQEDKDHQGNSIPTDYFVPSHRSLRHIELNARLFQLGYQSQFMLHNLVILIGICILILAVLPKTLAGENCPKQCTCNDELLEVVCNGPLRSSGLPHTLNPSLKKMIVNNALITQLPLSQLDTYKSLEVVNVAHNNLTTIDIDSLKSNEVIMTLNTSHNSISELKDSLLAMFPEYATILDKQNFFKELKRSKINIVELVVSHNRITILKDYTLARCHNLQHLDLSYNAIISLEGESLFGLNKLENLQLQGNRIKQLPSQALHSTIRSLKDNYDIESQLRTLDLSENLITSINSNSFNNLRQLWDINLASCNIEFIDEHAFSGLTTLRSLSIEDNHLDRVPTSALVDLRALRQLKLSGNNFTNIDALAFSNLYDLEELQINNGALTTLSQGTFKGLNYLRRLELANNKNLTRIESGTFHNLPRLAYLSLYGNSLTAIHNQPIFSEHLLRTLDLRNNSLHCDCDLKWLTKWLLEFNDTNVMARNLNSNLMEATNLHVSTLAELVNITCSGPPALEGRLIAALPDNGLECLTPSSDLNVVVGYASLLLMTFILTTVCVVNFCNDKKHLIGILKENLMQSRGISMILPYSQNVRKEVDGFKQEAQFECAEYERVGYYQTGGPVYTIPSEQYSSLPQQSHQL